MPWRRPARSRATVNRQRRLSYVIRLNMRSARVLPGTFFVSLLLITHPQAARVRMQARTARTISSRESEGCPSFPIVSR